MTKKVNALDLVLQSNWAITPEMLERIHTIASKHLLNPKDNISTEYMKPTVHAHEVDGYMLEDSSAVWVRDGVAIIPVFGVISKRMNMFTRVSGGVSTEILSSDFKKALISDDVKAILLNADTPGGTVDGTKACADMIYKARGQKPIITFANGQMTSGGMWIGSAADEIVAEETAVLGSIGVISIHEERSEADKKEGITKTVITAGKYKGIGNDAQPLTQEGKEYIQERLNYLYEIFGNAIALQRLVEPKEVFETMADGKIFIGKQALDIGLIDHIGCFEDAFALAKSKINLN